MLSSNLLRYVLTIIAGKAALSSKSTMLLQVSGPKLARLVKCYATPEPLEALYEGSVRGITGAAPQERSRQARWRQR